MDQATFDRIETATAGELTWHEASAAIRREFEGDDPKPALVVAIIQALDYHPSSQDAEDRRSQWGVYGPMIETDTGVYPVPLADTTDEVIEAWTEMASSLSSPAVKARLNDLLWEAKVDSAHLFAREAIAAFRALAARVEPVSITRADSLVRALELATAINDKLGIAAIGGECVEAVRAALESNEYAPGVALSLLEALDRLPGESQPGEVSDLIEQGLERYRGDPWITTNLADLAMPRAREDLEEVQRLEDVKIQAWVDAAEGGQGLVQTSFIENALDLATQYGRKDLANELRTKLQAASEDIELSKTSAEVEIPAEKVDAYVSSFIDRDDFAISLRRFATHCPLPESRNETAEFVRSLMHDHPLQYLFTKVVLGPGNLPLKQVSTPEEHFESAMESHESMSIELWGTFAAQILDRVFDETSPSRSEVRDFFKLSELTEIVADRLAEAYELYWDGRYDAAMMTALPRIETMLRDLSRRLGLVVFVEPRGNKPGGLKTLGAILYELTGHFDEQRRHYLVVLLCNPLTINLRNSALHGLIGEAGREYAALALHAATILSMYSVTPTTPTA